jgi:hypothetical protein
MDAAPNRLIGVQWRRDWRGLAPAGPGPPADALVFA